MQTITLSPALVVAGISALLLGLLVWRSAARKARAAADTARSGARAVSLAGRVLVFAGLIVGVEWVVITYAVHNATLVGVTLGLPALFAAYTVVKAVTIVGDDGRGTRRRGHR
ncbi:hypothetical protein [Actinokineospora spheciospongiae]|uniref:hypothetical protein n=1 Tax=Actinokineospora spheciospongiae TaxID=909613 RepID=UPI000D70BEAB|nr:hypothetical protein [Actinokineospora spheciospongiae]PWW65610.1 hypothetical protein DFQ13_102365 [Actinokineospora spheciospongiae]